MGVLPLSPAARLLRAGRGPEQQKPSSVLHCQKQGGGVCHHERQGQNGVQNGLTHWASWLCLMAHGVPENEAEEKLTKMSPDL